MEDIRRALLRGQQGTKLSKREYKVAMHLERKRLLQELIIYSAISFLIGLVLFLSLYPELRAEALIYLE
jgi:hypothetical protein